MGSLVNPVNFLKEYEKYEECKGHEEYKGYERRTRHSYKKNTMGDTSIKPTIPAMLGVYLGARDEDLLCWRAACEQRGEQATAFAKEAIREKLARERGQEADSLLLRQIMRVLAEHGEVLRQILGVLAVYRTQWGGEDASLPPVNDTPGNIRISSQSNDGKAFVDGCHDLGWG